MLESLVQRFLYWPERLPVDAPPPPWAQGSREVFMDAPDGNRIHALHWPAAVGRPTLLFLHGNAQTVFEWAMIRRELAPMDCGLLLLDYPGYGKSTGRPSEASCCAAGRAALEWLGREGVPPASTIVFGKSLGGGVAGEIAQDADLMGVVLESTFRSIPSVAARLLPMVPVGSLFQSERYDTASKLARFRAPVLVVHGTDDDLIPVAEGQGLFDLAREPKRLWLIPGAGHNDVSQVAGPEYGRVLREWVDGLADVAA
jgi:pimeloyl-ACP methyl ester carboxylesterase